MQTTDNRERQKCFDYKTNISKKSNTTIYKISHFMKMLKKKVIPQVKIIKIEHYKILNKSKCKDGTKYFN